MMMNKPDILEIIEREGIELKRRGRDHWMKHHGEKTASCKLSADKQTFYCFGCGAHGDVIDLIMALHNLSFKDACKYLGIIPGKPAPMDPAIQRQKKLQRDYETAIHNLWEKLCLRSRELYRIKLQVKKNPGALTEQGAAIFAGLMGELAVIENNLNILLQGEFEEKINLLEGYKNDCSREIKRAAA